MRKLTLLAFLLFFKASYALSTETAINELANLQSNYLKKQTINLKFVQKSKQITGEKPAVFKGTIFINRKLKRFNWEVKKPSKLMFSVNNDIVKIKSEEGPENKMKLSDLPASFKFIKSLFSVFGFEKLKSEEWKVSKLASFTFKLENKIEKLPIKDLVLILKKNGYPQQVNFSNSAGVSFNINFYEK